MNKMKNIFLVAVVLMTSTVFGQKFGHINSNDLLMAMPERNTVEETIKKEAQALEAQLTAMTKEYRAKVDDYKKTEATTTDAIKQDKITEISNLEERIARFQETAQETLQNKEQTMLKPIIDKAKKAIEDVAKENNYTMIFDSGLGVILYKKDSDDILPLVKKKLGLLN